MNFLLIKELCEIALNHPTTKSYIESMIKDLALDEYQLSPSEIQSGVTEGKIACIKKYKKRTQKSLTQCKVDVEHFFKLHNLRFKNHPA